MRTRERQRAPQASTDHYLSGAGIGASLVVEHLPENDGVVVPLVSRGVDQRCITFVSSRRQGVQARCVRRGRKLLMLPLLRSTAGTEAGHYLPARHARQPSADYGDPAGRSGCGGRRRRGERACYCWQPGRAAASGSRCVGGPIGQSGRRPARRADECRPGRAGQWLRGPGRCRRGGMHGPGATWTHARRVAEGMILR